MVKRVLILILILILSNAFAEDYVIEDGSLTPEEIQAMQDQIQQSNSVELSIQALGEQNRGDLQASSIFIAEQILIAKNEILVLSILINLATIGLIWALYLFLKSKKLL